MDRLYVADTENHAIRKVALDSGVVSTLSGTATYSVATTLVGSDSIIRATGQSFVGSNVAQVIKVNSISPGSGFFLTVTPAPVGPEYVVMWELVRTS